MKTILNNSNEIVDLWIGQVKIILNPGENIKIDGVFYIDLPKGVIEISNDNQKQLLFD